MDIIQYNVLLGILQEAGLTKNDVPDFDKIAEITGHGRDSVKSLLAPKAEIPRWVKLVSYVGEKLHTEKLTEADVVSSYRAFCGLDDEDPLADEDHFYISWVMTLLNPEQCD